MSWCITTVCFLLRLKIVFGPLCLFPSTSGEHRKYRCIFTESLHVCITETFGTKCTSLFQCERYALIRWEYHCLFHILPLCCNLIVSIEPETFHSSLMSFHTKQQMTKGWKFIQILEHLNFFICIVSKHLLPFNFNTFFFFEIAHFRNVNFRF